MTFEEKVKALRIRNGSLIKLKREPSTSFKKVIKIDYKNLQVHDTAGTWGLGMHIKDYIIANSSLEKRLYEIC